MGEARREALRVDFDRQIKLEFHGAAITSDAGWVAYRELDEALGLTAAARDMFRDPRHGKNAQHEFAGLLRLSRSVRTITSSPALAVGTARGSPGAVNST